MLSSEYSDVDDAGGERKIVIRAGSLIEPVARNDLRCYHCEGRTQPGEGNGGVSFVRLNASPNRHSLRLTSDASGETRLFREILSLVEPRTVDRDDERRGEEDVDDEVDWEGKTGEIPISS
jgi:hypothetical protein